MTSKATGPARSVLTTPIGGVAQAYLKAINPIAQLKQSAPSISLTVLFFIVVDPFLTRNRVEMTGEIPVRRRYCAGAGLAGRRGSTTMKKRTVRLMLGALCFSCAI